MAKYIISNPDIWSHWLWCSYAQRARLLLKTIQVQILPQCRVFIIKELVEQNKNRPGMAHLKIHSCTYYSVIIYFSSFLITTLRASGKVTYPCPEADHLCDVLFVDVHSLYHGRPPTYPEANSLESNSKRTKQTSPSKSSPGVAQLRNYNTKYIFTLVVIVPGLWRP